MKELLDEYKIEPTFTHANSLKTDLLKFEKKLDFFILGKFVIVNSSTINLCHCINRVKYSVVVLKGQGFQQKLLARSFASFVLRKVKIMTFKTLPKITEDVLDNATYLGKATTLIVT